MNDGMLSYRGWADLTLTYGTAPGLGRSAERPGVDVVVSRSSAGAPVSVLVDRQLGVALLLATGVSRATLVLPDGTVLAGAVQGVAESGDYFEIAAVSMRHRGTVMRNVGEFMPGLVLPPAYHGVLRQRVTEIKVANSAANCLIAQARAEGMVEALELLKALEADQIERLYLLIEQDATARLQELGRAQ